MAEKFTAFDAAEYLNDEKDIALYLEAAYLEAAQEEAGDDPAVMAMVLSDIARAQHEPTGQGRRVDAGWTLQGAFAGRQPAHRPRAGARLPRPSTPLR